MGLNFLSTQPTFNNQIHTGTCPQQQLAGCEGSDCWYSCNYWSGRLARLDTVQLYQWLLLRCVSSRYACHAPCNCTFSPRARGVDTGWWRNRLGQDPGVGQWVYTVTVPGHRQPVQYTATTLPTSAPGLVGGKTEPSSPSTNNLRAEVNEVRAANVTSSQGPCAPSSQWPELDQ